jgi:pimeloyl-ACP methyl ester carboxylesterase
MSAQAMARAFYLTASGREPVYALFDAAQPAVLGAAVGVLLCPLFGNDDICSYRSRREWARTLAAAGRPTLRIDLPGTGDSGGGPRDPERLEAWTDAVATAACWLREEAGLERVVAVGVGLGGLLSYRAASAGAPIDDLVLWSVPARGRTFVRQLRALSRMEASHATAAERDRQAVPDGALASAGFLLSPETVADLEALDLSELKLPHARARRLLLLERDGIEVDASLRGCLEKSGADVTVAPGEGYGRMVTPPQQSRPPLEVFATVETWLGAGHSDRRAEPWPKRADDTHEGAALTPTNGGERVGESDTLVLTIDGVEVRETPLTIEHEEGGLFGVLAEGEDTAGLCAVLLNAGALRHIGPNRMWVEIARRWAASGVPTLRIDLAGIGDSDGDAATLEEDEGLYVPRYVAQTLEVLEALASRGLPQRFVLAGLCSGSYWAMHTALHDARVAGAYMVNPRALFWDWRIARVRNAREMRKMIRAATWRKLLRGEIRATRVRDIALGVLAAIKMIPGRSSRRRQDTRLAHALDRLERTGTDLLWIFTAEEPLHYELKRSGGLEQMMRGPNTRVEDIPGPLTSHTLEPLPLQRTVHEMLDAALERQLQAAAAAPAGAIDA